MQDNLGHLLRLFSRPEEIPFELPSLCGLQHKDGYSTGRSIRMQLQGTIGQHRYSNVRRTNDIECNFIPESLQEQDRKHLGFIEDDPRWGEKTLEVLLQCGFPSETAQLKKGVVYLMNAPIQMKHHVGAGCIFEEAAEVRLLLDFRRAAL
jgi:hypothetical protein